MFELVTIQNKPWVSADDLATALEYSQPRAFLKLYREHKDEFTEDDILEIYEQNLQKDDGEGFSIVSSQNPVGSGRPRKFTYFSQDGAVLLCMFARTSNAKEARRQIREVFVNWWRGQQAATIPAFQQPIDDVPPPSQTPLFFATEPEVDVVINYNDNTVSLTLPLPELHRIVPLAGPQKDKKRVAVYTDTMLRRATQGMHGWYTHRQITKAVGSGPKMLRDRARDGRLPSGWLGEFRGGQWWVYIP